MYESNWKPPQELSYWYSQNHWWATILIVITGVLNSSIKYSKYKDGKAKNNKITIGKTVHTVSKKCESLVTLSIKGLNLTYKKK